MPFFSANSFPSHPTTTPTPQQTSSHEAKETAAATQHNRNPTSTTLMPNDVMLSGNSSDAEVVSDAEVMPADNLDNKGPIGIRPRFKPIIEAEAARKQAHAVVKFDPKKHLAYIGPTPVVSMKDIGYADDTGVSPVAVSDPFQLFTHDAIREMRSEIFNPVVMKNYCFSSNMAASQLRGYAKDHAPFTYAAWNHPDVLAIMSEVAGVDLVPQFDYEIAHINFSVKTDEQAEQELATINNNKKRQIDEGICVKNDDDDSKPVVGWHTDSYPFVCVLMMSDCTNMVGGETVLRTASGDIRKVRGPQQGSAVILQGRYITHQALRALGAKERITAVTSFRPRSAFKKDDINLSTVRPVSDLSELYYDFEGYRLEMMEQRIHKQREDLIARRKAGKRFNTLEQKKFINEAVAFMERTNDEIVDDNEVPAGFIGGQPDIPNVVVEDDRPTKRTRRE